MALAASSFREVGLIFYQYLSCKLVKPHRGLTLCSYGYREEALLVELPPEEFHLKSQDPEFMEHAQLIDVREPDEV